VVYYCFYFLFCPHQLHLSCPLVGTSTVFCPFFHLVPRYWCKSCPQFCPLLSVWQSVLHNNRALHLKPLR
jgi:hypothetical protein